ncbi:hypothetical protein FHW71_001266 [Enterobacter sp. Sphag1F]|nr:hypothetical protein [Enterobacter sp. Sphag1F]NYI13558.1 hypothetical protein [Enterobacter sp. Sphag71]
MLRLSRVLYGLRVICQFSVLYSVQYRMRNMAFFCIKERSDD